MDACSNRFCVGYIVSAVVGHAYSAHAYRFQPCRGFGSAQAVAAYDHVVHSGHLAQYPRGHGCWCTDGFCPVGGFGYSYVCGLGLGYRYCRAEFPRGSSIVITIAQRGNEQMEIVLGRHFVGCCRTNSLCTHRLAHHLFASSPHHLAISLGFCSGSYDVCGGGGTDSRVASRSTQQYSHIGFHRRFCLDDDPRLCSLRNRNNL